MWKYFTYRNTLKYIDILPNLIKGYNHSYHRSIKMRPVEVTKDNEDRVWRTLYPSITKTTNFKFNVGDKAGEPIEGNFYDYKLQSVNLEKGAVFRVENLLKTRKLDGRLEYFVKWKGYPAKFNRQLGDRHRESIMAAHFYVTLPSNSSFQYFPHNTLSSFTTQLAVLTGSWEVALCKIQYPFNWHNVTENSCRIRPNDREICFSHGYYDTMQDEIDKFHNLLTEDERNNVKIYQHKHNLRTTYKLKTGTTLALQGMSRMFGFLENNKVCTEGFTVSDISSDVHSGLTSFLFTLTLLSTKGWMILMYPCCGWCK
ncbi:hypothetical protein HOLleu_18959 [Holothuria leucospilota]|uniref:Chromo domain-containing protein n=1 Tax=Holothuria leucospilota TaxID=206669 RepID=A0A9Q1C2J9_HOLLE|nr:hypothetical protein HOLleu_18959 [Holothuria leucospilota]